MRAVRLTVGLELKQQQDKDFEMNIQITEETETIDRLFLELSQFTKAKTRREMQLDELLYAVERKFPGETRFETALRYIRNAESSATQGPVSSNEK